MWDVRLAKPPGACLRAKSKYAGGGYGRGVPLPYVRKKNQNMNLMVASPAFSES